MQPPETAILRQRVIREIRRRVGSSTEANGVAAAARLTHDDLTAVFAPLISSGGVDALWGRSLDLAQREYPAGDSADDVPTGEPFDRARLWLEKQVPSVATDAAAAIFVAFAELLAALIGEPLTTRYLEKAWPDGFSDALPKGKKT